MRGVITGLRSLLVQSITVVLLCLTPLIALTKDTSRNISELLLENARFAIDFSSRGISREGDESSVNVVGLDYHKVVSFNNKDIATFIAQPYWVHFSNANLAPYFFDGKKHELTWRITNVNFKLDGRGSRNFRVGHFEIPFGLEQFADTNGTLRQYTFSDRNIKADWGATLNGINGAWDYEFALSRGSGNDISDRDNPGLFSGRVGYTPNQQSILGFSIFTGDVQVAQGVRRHHQAGFDASYFFGKYQVMSELSFGELEGNTRYALFSEFGWNNRSEITTVYLQLRKRWSELAGDDLTFYSLGMSLIATRHFTLSGQLNWSETDTRSDETTALIQFRLRI